MITPRTLPMMLLVASLSSLWLGTCRLHAQALTQLPEAGPEGQPADLPAAALLPELPPLRSPSDGLAAPPLPDVPGLVLPTENSIPAAEQGLPNGVDALTKQLTQDAVYWHKSPRQARALAQQKGRPMLLVFGGFAWSPACKALNNDLFTNVQFNAYAAEHLVLSFLNVPTKATSSGGTVTDVHQLQYEAIKSYQNFLHVRSLPTLILFDAEGHEIMRQVGYNFNRDLRVQSYKKLEERVLKAVDVVEKQKAEEDHRRKMLSETQRYRFWTSRYGSRLFAKASGLVDLPTPTDLDEKATQPAAALMDERGTLRYIPLKSLDLMDAEIVKRKFSPNQPPSTDPPGYYDGLPLRGSGFDP